MTPLQIVGVIFVALMLVFIAAVIIILKKASPTQDRLLRFFCSICAGFAGGIFVGDVLLTIVHKTPTTEIALRAVSGFALYLITWYTWAQVLSPGYNTTMVSGQTFESAVRGFLQSIDAVPEFTGFEASELALPLPSQTIKAKSPQELIQAIATLNREIPPFVISGEGAILKLEKNMLERVG